MDNQKLTLYRANTEVVGVSTDTPTNLTSKVLAFYLAKTTPVRQSSILTLTTGAGISGQDSVGNCILTLSNVQMTALPGTELFFELWNTTDDKLMGFGIAKVQDTIAASL